ncbi:DUF3397 family protein [Lysinibacillus endophyticus]|uniref:DUF3397 family protein n=1 Tax=Ureibacillus endophyticus TaxID=1978490 RepID=A0A494ZAG9_9BACL|nr:DUF3397 family protein [Lysinibacillus endophyticus]MCP1143931.1 DUF3397 domain-containing protein [Lysinibacillus endophyticus]RKQ19699.1 DUF3397 family protein [Lysinibacillus endophyticus]
MKILFQYVISTIILFPIILFFISFFICRKRKKSKSKSFGYSSDVTTFVLFFSVPLSIKSLWEVNLSILIISIAIIIAIIFTYIDWRTKKEIEVLPLFKKVWRLFFILLTLCYFIVWIVGLVQSIINYVN